MPQAEFKGGDRGELAPEAMGRLAALEAARIVRGAAHQSSVDGGYAYQQFLKTAQEIIRDSTQHSGDVA